MRACITGGTGFVGTTLSHFLAEKGYEVVIFSRSPEGKKDDVHPDKISFASYDELKPVIAGSKVVINLAGENLFDQRWTDEVKSRILKSRVKTTRAVVKAIVAAETKPDVLISASAVGYYGTRGDEFLNEDAGSGADFLSKVCLQWEEEAEEVRKTGVRLAVPRIGIVLEKNGGALEKMITPFSMFVGGPLGNGKQFFPWVHMDDVSNALWFAISEEKLDGPFNLCSPNPVTMKEFASELGKAMNRPSFFPVPEVALKLLVGEAAAALTASQRAVPEKLQSLGFKFRFSEPGQALKQILSE